MLNFSVTDLPDRGMSPVESIGYGSKVDAGMGGGSVGAPSTDLPTWTGHELL